MSVTDAEQEKLLSSNARNSFVRATYFCFSVPGALVAWIVFAVVFLQLTGLSIRSSFHEISFVTQTSLVIGVPVSLVLGMSIGGWVWARIAKRIWNVSREEMVELLIGGRFSMRYLDRVNLIVIDNLFRAGRGGKK